MATLNFSLIGTFLTHSEEEVMKNELSQSAEEKGDSQNKSLSRNIESSKKIVLKKACCDVAV